MARNPDDGLEEFREALVEAALDRLLPLPPRTDFQQAQVAFAQGLPSRRAYRKPQNVMADWAYRPKRAR